MYQSWLTKNIGGVQIYLEARTFLGSPVVDDDLSESIQFQLLDEKGETLQTVAVVEGGAIRPADVFPSSDRQDYYEQHIIAVMDEIGEANPGAFDGEGKVVGKDWVRLVIPENTVDIFQLYSHLLLAMLEAKVHWVDSWYYHLHGGGIHCGTNVLRSLHNQGARTP